MDAKDLKRKDSAQRDGRSMIYTAKSHDQLGDEESITGHFQQIIEVPSDAVERATVRSKGRSVRLYVAGNHDVGFGDTLIRKAMQRYKNEFGSVNYKIQVGNHTLVVLDTLALSSDTPSIHEESQEFLSQIGQDMTRRLVANTAKHTE
ncbi:hypothetical protein BG011_000239 [Mortierella polycephala]|uniref:Uncharacterized protein n=1 Tax=Mortierella polycephala TaxID=41804 RepID=A0A9P6U7A6_9FUNG|nr:hypothetical protein BG011_000239 [Mortierella polycephala]